MTCPVNQIRVLDLRVSRRAAAGKFRDNGRFHKVSPFSPHILYSKPGTLSRFEVTHCAVYVPWPGIDINPKRLPVHPSVLPRQRRKIHPINTRAPCRCCGLAAHLTSAPPSRWKTPVPNSNTCHEASICCRPLFQVKNVRPKGAQGSPANRRRNRPQTGHDHLPGRQRHADDPRQSCPAVARAAPKRSRMFLVNVV